jgi:hypothetical protein
MFGDNDEVVIAGRTLTQSAPTPSKAATVSFGQDDETVTSISGTKDFGQNDETVTPAKTPSIVETGAPEKPENITAQFGDMFNPDTGRDAVFVGAKTENPIASKPLPKNVIKVDSPAGVLYTTNKEKADLYTKNPDDVTRSKVLGYNQTKKDVLTSGKQPQAVVVKDANGKRLYEELTTDPDAVIEKYKKQGYKNISLETPIQTQIRRAAANVVRPDYQAKSAGTHTETAELPVNSKPYSMASDIKEAIKEIPADLKIGTVGLGASVLNAVKHRAMQLSGGGIMPDDMVKSQYEAVVPTDRKKLQPGELRVRKASDLFDVNRIRNTPMAAAGESLGMVTRLPDIGARILEAKEKSLQDKQSPATMKTKPVTRLSRAVWQGGVPSIGASVAASLLTGDPVTGLMILGETSGGQAFAEQLKSGASIQKSGIVADLTGLAEIGGELLVFPKFLKGLKEGIPLKKAFGLILENAGQEGVTGFTQTFVDVFAKATTKGMDVKSAAKMAFNEGAKAIPENAFVGGATAGLVDAVAGTASAGRKISDKIDAKMAETKTAPAPADQKTNAPISEQTGVIEPKTKATPVIEQKTLTPAKYTGNAYRVETGSERRPEAKTAADVIRFEQEELGNDDMGVSPEKIKELENIPAKDIVWVTRDKQVAADLYGDSNIDIVEDYTKEVRGGEIIADIGEDGVLVLKPKKVVDTQISTKSVDDTGKAIDERQTLPAPVKQAEIKTGQKFRLSDLEIEKLRQEAKALKSKVFDSKGYFLINSNPEKADRAAYNRWQEIKDLSDEYAEHLQKQEKQPSLEEQAKQADSELLSNLRNTLEQKKTLTKDDTAILKAVKKELRQRYLNDPKWSQMSDEEWLNDTRFYRSGKEKMAELPDGRSVILKKESTATNFKENSKTFLLSTKPKKSATLPPMAEEQAARDNIAPQDTAEAGKGKVIENQDDVFNTVSRILREQFPTPARSAKSEAHYFDNGEIRIRLAEHPVVHAESESDVVIGIGKNAGLDSDLNFDAGKHTEAEIRSAIDSAIEKAVVKKTVKEFDLWGEEVEDDKLALARKHPELLSPKIIAEYPELKKSFNPPAPEAGKGNLGQISKQIDIVQKQIDDKIDELQAKGLKFEDADNHPETKALYEKRFNLDNALTSEYASRIQKVFKKNNVSDTVSKYVMKDIYSAYTGKQSGMEVSMLADYGRKAFDNPQDTIKKLATRLFTMETEAKGMSPDGVLSQMSGYTEAGKKQLLEKYAQKAEKIHAEMIESAIKKTGLSPRYKDKGFTPDPGVEDEPTGEGGFVAMPSGRGEKGKIKKPWLDMDKVKSPDEDIEAFFGRTHRPPYSKKASSLIDKFTAGLRERFILTHHMPQTAETAYIRDLIRTMPEERRYAVGRAMKDIIAILDGDGTVQALDSPGLDLLRRLVFTQDILNEAQLKRSVAGNFRVEDTGEFDVQKLQTELDRLMGLMNQVPSVKKAYDARQKLWEDVSQDLLKRGVLGEEEAANKAYVRHFVLDLAEKNGPTGFKRKKLSGPYRAYSKHRKGSVKDISTDYLSVEVKALADIYADNVVEDVANKISEKENRRKEYTTASKAVNFRNLVGGQENIDRINWLRQQLRDTAKDKDSDIQAQRSDWIQELTELDPTYPYRKRIAMHMSKIRKSGTYDDLDDDTSGLFKELARLASEEAKSPLGMAARGVFKAMAERDHMIRERLGRAFLTPVKLAEKDGYVEWFYKRPNVFYRASTLAESQIAAFVENSAEEVGDMLHIPKSKLRQALVLGRRKGMIIPDWLAAQLDDLPVNKRSGYIVRSFTTPFIQFWKRWILRVNPLRYNFRNQLGDTERLNASGQTSRIMYIPQALKSLITKQGEYYDLMKQFGVAGSSLWHEMNDVSKLPEFERFKKMSNQKDFKRAMAKLFTLPLRTVSKVGSIEQSLTQLREDVLRAAVFIGNYEDLKTGKPVRHWAGSIADIEAIAKEDPARAAAKISRETLGDYGAFTSFENDVLRQGVLPFYSWMKINGLFWPRILLNAAKEGKGSGVAKILTGKVGFNIAKWLIRVLWAYAAAYLWNHKDGKAIKKEESLPFWLRAIPHVNIDNTTIWGQTALSDFTEWFGMDELAGIMWRHEAGFMNLEQATMEAAKVMAQAPVNKVYQALNPFLKAPITVIAGQSTYPNIFNPHYVAKPASLGSAEVAMLDIMGGDAKKFYRTAIADKKGNRRALDETLNAYFVGWFARQTDPDTFIEDVKKTLEKTSYKETVTGHKAGDLYPDGRSYKGNNKYKTTVEAHKKGDPHKDDIERWQEAKIRQRALR